MRSATNNLAGFTLVDLIISIVLLSVMIPLSYITFSGLVKNMGKPEYAIDARYVLEIEMEQLTRVPFASIANCNNAGCTSHSYQDVDAVSAYPEYAGFQWKCTVTPVSFNAGTNTVIDDPSSTTMKRIGVDVKAPDGSTYSAHTLVSQRPADEE
jgi:hypothetical protein